MLNRRGFRIAVDFLTTRVASIDRSNHVMMVLHTGKTTQTSSSVMTNFLSCPFALTCIGLSTGGTPVVVQIYPSYSNYVLHDFVATRISFGCLSKIAL